MPGAQFGLRDVRYCRFTAKDAKDLAEMITEDTNGD
jgi:hypothetical protein